MIEKRTKGIQNKKAKKKYDPKHKPADGSCPYAKKCGGCDYQGISYEEQLKKKQSYIRKLMEPYGKVQPIIKMDDPYHYRHKVQAAFDCTRRGQSWRAFIRRIRTMSLILKAARLRMKRPM